MTVTEAIQAHADALLRELREGDPAEGVLRAQAMMAAATGFLTRLAGHDVVAAQLRADADTVEAHKLDPDLVEVPEPALTPTVMLH